MKAISFNDFIPCLLALSVLVFPLAQCLNVNYDTKLPTDIIPDSKLSTDSSSSSPTVLPETKTEDVGMTTSMKNKDKDKSTIEFSGISARREEGGLRKKVEGRACPDCLGSACDDNIPSHTFDPVFLPKLFIALFLGTVAYFCFWFGYKKWAFHDLPYHLSPSFERPEGSGGYSKMSSRTGFGSLDWNSILSQTQSAVFNAIEKLY